MRAGTDDAVYMPWPTCAAFSVADGKVLWNNNGQRYFGPDNNWSSPAVVGDTIYFQDFHDFHADCSARIIKFSPGGGKLNATLSKRLDCPSKIGCANASPLFDNGLLYLLTRNGRMAVFDVTQNAHVYDKLLEMYSTQGWVSDPGVTSSPALSSQYIYMNDDHFNTVVIKPGKTCEQVSINNIWNEDYIVSSPVPVGSNLYLRGYDYLYCIGEK